MELQFQSSTCQYLEAVCREVRNTELTQEVRLSDGMPDIGRVLTSWGQVILRSKEWQGDLVTVAGGVMVWVLYAPEDGTPPRCMDTWVPFQLKWELEQPVSEGQIRVYPLLRFVDGRGVSARKMMIRVGVAAMCEALSPSQSEIFHTEERPADIQLLKNTYLIRIPKEAGEKTFLIDEELQLPAGAVQLERLLAYTITPQILEKRVAGDKVIMRGAGKVHTVYRCDEGNIHTAELEIPYAQFAQLEDTYGNDAMADILMGTTSLELIQMEGNTLRMKCGMVAQYLVTDRYLAETVEDAYSVQRDLKIKMEELNLPSILEQRTELIQAQQKLPGLEGNVVDVVFLPDFPRQSRTEDQVKLDIAGQFQLLYYEQDGSLQSSSAHWEKSMEIAADQESSMSYLVQPYGAVQTVTGADELNLNGQLKLEMLADTQTKIPMVSGLELGEMVEPNAERPSLILCRQQDRTLWSIAKHCGSTVEEICRVNHLDGTNNPEQLLLIPVS